MKIVTVVGARPQFVKAAVVSRAISRFNEEKREKVIKEVIVHISSMEPAEIMLI